MQDIAPHVAMAHVTSPAIPARDRNAPRSLTLKAVFIAVLAILAGAALSRRAAAGQIYVTNYAANTIGEYDATTGVAINASLVSGLHGPWGIAVSGSHLFVVNYYSGSSGPGSIAEYDAITGAPINTALVTGLHEPTAIAVSGSDLFVAESESNRIGEYDAVTGATINASLIPVIQPSALTVVGSDLFVNYSGAVGEYITSGATVDATLIGGGGPGIAISGPFVFLSGNTGVAEYSTSGLPLNTSLITGINAYAIAAYGSDLFVSYNSDRIGEYTLSARR